MSKIELFGIIWPILVLIFHLIYILGFNKYRMDIPYDPRQIDRVTTRSWISLTITVILIIAGWIFVTVYS